MALYKCVYYYYYYSLTLKARYHLNCVESAVKFPTNKPDVIDALAPLPYITIVLLSTLVVAVDTMSATGSLATCHEQSGAHNDHQMAHLCPYGLLLITVYAVAFSTRC